MKAITFASLLLAFSFLCWKANAQMPAPLNSNNVTAVKLFLANVDSPHPDFKQTAASMGDPGFRKSAMAYQSTTGEQQTVQTYLKAVATGNASFDEWYQRLEDPFFRHALFAYYSNATTSMSPPLPIHKYLVATGYLKEGNLSEAIKLDEECVRAEPTNFLFQAFLGTALLENRSYGRAMDVFAIVVAGLHTNQQWADVRSFINEYAGHLSYAALMVGRVDVVKTNVETLAGSLFSDFSSDSERIQVGRVLMTYALGTHDEQLFIKALKFADSEEETTRYLMRIGCESFSAPELVLVRHELLDYYSKPLPPNGPTQHHAMTGEERERVRRLILNEEQGKGKLYSAMDTEAVCPQLIAYYEESTNGLPTRAKLGLSECLGNADRYAEAYKVASDYAQVYSNDWRGWQALGLIAFKAHCYSLALDPLDKAAQLGGKDAQEMYEQLAMSGFFMGRMEILNRLAPYLLQMTQAKVDIPDFKNGMITALLIVHSVIRQDASLFVKSLGGVSAEQLLNAGSPDSDFLMRSAFILGWNRFHPKEVEPLWTAYQKVAYEENRGPK